MTSADADADGPGDQPRNAADDATRVDGPDESTLVGPGGARPSRPPSTERPGDAIGPFTLVSQLGEGGFGTVWLAERSKPFVQRVALKLVKAGLDSAAVIGRFEQERQALAVMNHPNVARVLDGGLTATGRPYFAMEFVKGSTISDFCDSRKLAVDERLRLFLQVCDAVQHAHSKGIIHRDLKPSNVLVTVLDDGKPLVKVIDFGVAKALTQEFLAQDMFTMTGQMVGTPEYMSPEQAEPGAVDIDTRADVYSLGVMLYELLTGMLPFDPRSLRSNAYREIQRIIREVDPPTPSTRLSSMVIQDSAAAAAIAGARRARLEQIAATLRNELEWIPLKAMRKEREQRYSTPLDLARDIENYLEGRPLVAGPETFGYRIRKYARRHRTAVAMVSVVAVSLIAATAASTAFGIREARARRLAEQREREVSQVLDFQQRQLASVGQEQAGLAMFREIARQRGNASEAAGGSAAERDAVRARVVDELRSVNPTDVAFSLIRSVILAQAVADADANHRSEPFLHAGLLAAIGRTYLELGDFDRARELLERARSIWERELGPDDRRTLRAREWVARSGIESDAGAALAGIEAVVADRERLFGPDDPDTIDSLRVMAGALARAGRQQDAVPVAERVARAAVVSGGTGAVADLALLGRAYMEAGRATDAERALLDARGRLDGMSGASPRLRATVASLLGLVQTRMDDPAKVASGVAFLREANALDEQANGEQHAASFDSRGNLAVTLAELAQAGKGGGSLMADALAIHENSRRIGASLDFPPNAYYLSLNDLANWKAMNAPADPAQRRAQVSEAVRLAEEAYRTLSARSGVGDDYLLQMRAAVGLLHLQAGDAPTAERVLLDVLGTRSKSWTPGFKDMVNLRSDLAMSVAAQGRWSDAVDLLSSTQQDAERELNDRSEARWRLANRLLGFLGQWAGADPSSAASGRIAAQRETVERLRAARAAAGLDTVADERWSRIPN